MRRRLWRWAAWLALAGAAAALSGCYYDPYTGWYYPYPPPPPYPYAPPPAPYGAPPGNPPAAAPPPGNGPVTQTPLPPPR
jgi:hypothetical protein